MPSGSQDLGTGYNNATTESLGLISGATGGSPQGIYEESSTQEYPIGTKREFEDGRVFRYASFGAATAAGVLVSQDVSATAVIEIENVATAAAVGATEVILTDSGTLGSATANQYAGAYLHTVDDAGEGYTYRIKSNTAASSNAVTFTLYDGLVVAVSSGCYGCYRLRHRWCNRPCYAIGVLRLGADSWCGYDPCRRHDCHWSELDLERWCCRGCTRQGR